MKALSNKRDVANDQFHRQTQKLFEDCMKGFIKKSASLILEDSGWGSKVE